MQKLTLILFLAVALLSCEENKDLNVTVNESGNVQVKSENAGNAIEEAGFTISTAFEEQNRVIFEDSTNASGLCEVGKLLQDEYRCDVKYKVERRYYHEQRYFQVVAGESKTMELNPIANSGTLRVNVLNPEDEPIEGVYVAMIPHYQYNNYTYEAMQEEAWY